jgi:DNA-binding MarR family transcriptional regulator
MPTAMNQDELVELLRRTTIALVRRDGADLTIRQMAVFMSCYLDTHTDHTVRGLAALLHISKPAITRALDRLSDMDLIQRKVDPADRRSVVVRQTTAGMSFFRDLTGIVHQAAGDIRQPAAETSNATTPVPVLEPA